MIRIESGAWADMVAHARKTYPSECCGAMIGSHQDDGKLVTEAIPLENAYDGPQNARYELRPQDLYNAEKQARERSMDLIGIYHSHPDCDAYFSTTDLQNSSPWHSFVVLSIRRGEFDHANCFVPNLERTEASKEELIY